MKERRLGASGPTVSAVGLGCMYLSLDGRPEEKVALRTIHAALDVGVTLLDTADAYCKDEHEIGHNERLVAKALAGRRDACVIATKGGLRRPGGGWVPDGRPDHLLAACDASLRALGVDTIDLYQLHEPDPAVPFEESVGALARLREQGKVRLVGLSNVSVAQLGVARGIVPVASVQNQWNVYCRRPETQGMLSACETSGVAFIAYSPFGGGNRAPKLDRNEKLAAEAKRRGITPHRLLLAWMLAKSDTCIVVPGCRQDHNARDSAWAATLELSAAEVAAIEETL
jgi:aryl-alcohol dehydrogenase-like predicted oxidoreductase